jgi:uncharacterized membrane protein YphA (DoxX/SURF4 family)
MVVRRIARPLLGAAFVSTGVDALRDVGTRAEHASRFGVGQPDTVARANAGVQIGGGLLLALGRFPRLSALALAATVVPEAVTGHAFWEQSDKHEKSLQRALFFKDIGLLGGLVVAIADTGGRESVPHEARRTAEKASRKAAKQAKRVAA